MKFSGIRRIFEAVRDVATTIAGGGTSFDKDISPKVDEAEAHIWGSLSKMKELQSIGSSADATAQRYWGGACTVIWENAQKIDEAVGMSRQKIGAKEGEKVASYYLLAGAITGEHVDSVIANMQNRGDDMTSTDRMVAVKDEFFLKALERLVGQIGHDELPIFKSEVEEKFGEMHRKNGQPLLDEQYLDALMTITDRHISEEDPHAEPHIR